MQLKWGHLQIIARQRYSIQYNGHKLGEFAENWTLKCDCGIVFDQDSRTFPGRNKMRSCGFVSCPHSSGVDSTSSMSEHSDSTPTRKVGRPSSRSKNKGYTFYLADRVHAMLDAYQAMRLRTKVKLTRDAAVTELLTLGWESLKVPDEPPKQTF